MERLRATVASLRRQVADLQGALQLTDSERVAQLKAFMLADDSEYSLHYENEEEMEACLLEAVDAMDSSSSDGTIINEASNFKHWLRFCEHRQTPVYRMSRRLQTPA